MTPHRSSMYRSNLVHLLYLALHLSTAPVSHALTLTTRSSIRGVSVQQLQTFLSTPTNWPTILISAHSVQSVLGSKYAVDKPLRKGEQVRELFGLPPILPFSVVWTCRSNDKNGVELVSSEGLANVASNCNMKFSFPTNVDRGSNVSDGTTVLLTVSYDPVSPLAVFAVLLLTLENEFALKVLLPYAMRQGQRP